MRSLNPKTFFILLALLLPADCLGQTVYEGQVVNTITEETIPDVNVRLLKAKTATRTNSQGYYRLKLKNALPYDTLVFSFVGYKTFMLPVAAYQNNMFIKLDTAQNKLNQVTVNAKKNKPITLDRFTLGQTRDTRHVIIYVTQPFYTLGMFAKEFFTPRPDAMLKTIKLARRDFDIPFGDDFPLTTSNPFTRFLVHVMAPNSATGGPGKKIFSKEISLTDKAIIVTIDLTKDKLVLPQQEFFVAIEWLPIPYNEIIRLNIGHKVEKVRTDGEDFLQDASRYQVMYQPILVKFEGYSKNPVWIARDGVNWRREIKSPGRPHLENYFCIALSATISY